MMTKKILFLHGFFASGSCIALRQAFVGKAEVLTPDLPLHPKEALTYRRHLSARNIKRKEEWRRLMKKVTKFEKVSQHTRLPVPK